MRSLFLLFCASCASLRPSLPILFASFACFAGHLAAQPANVQADPTTGALFRPAAATFISGNSLLTTSGAAAAYQPLDAELAAISGLSSNGLIARTSSSTAAARILTGTAGQITVTNGDGVSGNPTLSLPTALTSVNSVTAATTTDLTLSGGSSGASLVLGQGASGAAAFTLPGSGGVTATQTRNGQAVLRLTNASTGTGAFANLELVNSGFTGSLYQFGTGYTTSGRFVADSLLLDSGGTGGLAFGATNGNITWYQGGNTATMRLAATTGNLLIGGTTDISGTGGLKVFGTTASTSTTTGSLVNAGGFGNTGAAYIGGLVSTGSRFVFTGPGAVPGASELAIGTNGVGTRILYNVPTGGEFNFTVNGTTVTAINATTGLYTTGLINSTNTTASTSTTTGSLVNAGGFGNAGAAHIGGIVHGHAGQSVQSVL